MNTAHTEKRIPVKGILIVLLVGTVILTPLVSWQFRDRLANTIPRMENGPLTPAEFETWKAAPPEDQNAALVYEEAYKVAYKIYPQLVKGATLDMDSNPQKSSSSSQHLYDTPECRLRDVLDEELLTPVAESIQKRLEAVVIQDEPVYALLDKASAYARCCYPLPAQPEETYWEQPYLKQSHYLNMLVRIYIIHHTLQQHPDKVVDGFKWLYAQARSLDECASLWGQGYRHGIMNHGYEMLEWSMNRISFTPEQLDAIQGFIQSCRSSKPIIRAIQGNYYLSVYAIREEKFMVDQIVNIGQPLYQLGDAFVSVWNDLVPRHLNGMATRNLQKHANYGAKVLAILQEPEDKQYGDIQQLNKVLDKLNFPLPYECYGFIRTMSDYCCGETMADLAITVMAIEKFHQASHRYPSSLEELCPTYLPTVPRDRLGYGDPLHYLLTGDGCKVYSVWRDRMDNGGVTNRKYYQYRDGMDLVFQLTHTTVPVPAGQ